jgi:hypothetical protein
MPVSIPALTASDLLTLNKYHSDKCCLNLFQVQSYSQFKKLRPRYNISTTDIAGTSNEKEVYGTGLKNAAGEYNCFLNVIIQSLWHLKRFRDGFLKTSSLHKHVEDPCAVCALYDIFTDLSKASEEQGEAVAPTSLRIALSKSYPNSKFFQEVQSCTLGILGTFLTAFIIQKLVMHV